MMWRRMGRFGAVRAVVLFGFAGCNFRFLGATRFTEISLVANGMDESGNADVKIDYSRFGDRSTFTHDIGTRHPRRPYAENLFPQVENEVFQYAYTAAQDGLQENSVTYDEHEIPLLAPRIGVLAVPIDAPFYNNSLLNRAQFMVLQAENLLHVQYSRGEDKKGELVDSEKVTVTEKERGGSPITFTTNGVRYCFVTKSKLWWGHDDTWGSEELNFEPLGFLWQDNNDTVYLSALQPVGQLQPDEHLIRLYKVDMDTKTPKKVFESSGVKVSAKTRLPVRYIKGKIYLTYIHNSHSVESISLDINNLKNTQTLVLIKDLRKTFGFHATRMISAFLFNSHTTVMLECEGSGEYFMAFTRDPEKIEGELFSAPYHSTAGRDKRTAYRAFSKPTAMSIVQDGTLWKSYYKKDFYKKFQLLQEHSLSYMHGRAYNVSNSMLLFTNPAFGSLVHCCGKCKDLYYTRVNSDDFIQRPFGVTTYGNEVFLSVERENSQQAILRFTIEKQCALKWDRDLYYETDKTDDEIPYRIQYLAAAPHEDPITKTSTSLLYASGYANVVTLIPYRDFSTPYLLGESVVVGPILMCYSVTLDVGVLMATMTSPKVDTVLYQVHLKKEAKLALQLKNPYRPKFAANFIAAYSALRSAKLEPYGDPPATSFHTLDQGLYCSLGILTSIWLLVSNIMRHDAKVLE